MSSVTIQIPYGQYPYPTEHKVGNFRSAMKVYSAIYVALDIRQHAIKNAIQNITEILQL